MKKYFMTAALALVLGTMAFTPAAQAQGSGKAFGVQQGIATPNTAVVQPGFTDREREYIGAGRAAMVNPGFYRQRQDIFDYWNIHGTLPANFNANMVGLTSDRELLEIFSNARKVGQARMAFLCGLRSDIISKYDFSKVDYWSLRFANVDALKNFVLGYFNGYIYGFADKVGRFSADRSDLIFYSLKEAEAFRQDMIGGQL